MKYERINRNTYDTGRLRWSHIVKERVSVVDEAGEQRPDLIRSTGFRRYTEINCEIWRMTRIAPRENYAWLSAARPPNAIM